VAYDDLPLSEVIKTINQEARNRDPEKKGINFRLSTPEILDPLAWAPVERADADMGAISIRITPAQKNITLRQLLDILVLVADRPIKYVITHFGVVMTRRDEETPTLHTRWYKIDPGTFMHALESNGIKSTKSTNHAMPTPLGEIRGLDRGGINGDHSEIDFTSVQTSQDLDIKMFQNYFQTLGVDLTTPPKSVILNDRLGMLMVRATLPDLEIVEKAVHRLNMAPPQVWIKVEFCEVSDESIKASGFDWLTGSVTNHQPSAATDASHVNTNSVLTPQQYAVVLHALQQREGTKLFSTLSVLTLSGRQAHLKTSEVRKIVLDLNLDQATPGDNPSDRSKIQPIPKQHEIGPAIDVVPYVAADGFTIQMTIVPTVKEFVGYDLDSRYSKDIWDYVESPGANPAPRRMPAEQSPPTPIFRLRQFVTSAVVRDGQTVVLGGLIADGITKGQDKVPMLGDLPEMGRLFRKEATVAKQMRLLVFITSTIVDPAGNRVHSDEDIPARTNSVPPQDSKP
jgi:type II secretory pathway component GspD/PulD (secretin)